MELTPFVDSLRDDLTAAAAAGTDETREIARLLAVALDASVRLCLVDALSAMAAEVTAAGDLGSVEIRMHGREPQVVVTPLDEPHAPAAASAGSEADGDDDGGTARVTLRLPEALKVQAEEAANKHNLSLNAWLVRAVAAALRGADGMAGTPSPRGRSGRTITGFARS